MRPYLKRASSVLTVMIGSALLGACVSISEQQFAQNFRYDYTAKLALTQRIQTSVPGQKGTMIYFVAYSSRSNMQKFRDTAGLNQREVSQAPAVMHAHVEFDYRSGFPLYRLSFKPHNFGVAEMTKWGAAASVRLDLSRSSKEQFIAPLPRPLRLNQRGMIETDWVFCAKCFDPKIDSSAEGLRLARKGMRKAVGKAYDNHRGAIDMNVSVPNALLTGRQAVAAAQRLGAQVQSFDDQRRRARPANNAYLAFIKDYKKRLPENKMKYGCETERSASVGDIKSKRRALRINRDAVRCRERVLQTFNANFYRANYSNVKRQEARLYNASYGVQRSEIYSPDEVMQRAKKKVRDARSLARSFGADVQSQRARNQRSRERNRRENAARAQILSNAAQTNRAFQKQQRDIGTQQIDPVTGRVTTRSQRAAEAARLGEISRRNAAARSKTASRSGTSKGGSFEYPKFEAEQPRCRPKHASALQCMKSNPRLSYGERAKLTQSGKDWRAVDADYVCRPLWQSYRACRQAGIPEVEVKASKPRGSTNR